MQNKIFLFDQCLCFHKGINNNNFSHFFNFNYPHFMRRYYQWLLKLYEKPDTQ